MYAHEVEVGDREYGSKFLSLSAIHDSLQDEGDTLRGVLLKQFAKLLSVCLARLAVHPALPVGPVAEVLGIDKHHPTPRHSGRTGVL